MVEKHFQKNDRKTKTLKVKIILAYNATKEEAKNNEIKDIRYYY